MYPVIDIFGVKVFTFPLVMLIAVFACLFMYVLNRTYQTEYIFIFLRSLMTILIGAAIFGRLLSALTLMYTSDNSFFYNLLYGGFVFYGGVIGGIISGLIYCIIRHQSFIEIADVFLSLLPLGQAIGRIGCYLNGCCYGYEYYGIFSVPYIVNGTNTRVFPTWLIEASFCLLLAIYFQLFCKTTVRGFRTSVYFIAYSSFRFIIEFFRGDAVRGVFGWISTSQFISVAFFVSGIFVLIYFRTGKKDNKLLRQRSVIYGS